MTDPQTQLTLLRAQRDATEDPTLRAALDAAIAALESTAPPPPTTPTQQIDNIASNQGLQGNFTAANQSQMNVQTGGTRYAALIQLFLPAAEGKPPDAPDDRRELLISYLDSLAQRCDRLRLHGVVDWERKRGKAPAFTLSQVYVTLAAQQWIVLNNDDDAETFAEATAQGIRTRCCPRMRA
jgi:hypothetical protein